jgi:hypothetical protein
MNSSEVSPSECPSRELLFAFSVGDLAGEIQERIAQHLERCGGCVAALQELDHVADPLLGQLRQSLPPDIVPRSGGATTVADESPSLDPAARAEATPGKRYRVVEFHARGGLGEVFVAQDSELHRAVALKRLQARHQQDPESRRRFLREAEITARLEHPGVVPVYGRDQDQDGQPCYAMRFIHGQTLEEAIQRFHAADQPGRDPGGRRLALRELLGRYVAVCNTVAYAHSRGILHRDLKGAVAAYKRVLALDPRDATIWNSLGKALLAQEDLAGAITAFQKALTLDPKDAWTNLGALLCVHKRDYDGAIAALKPWPSIPGIPWPGTTSALLCVTRGSLRNRSLLFDLCRS